MKNETPARLSIWPPVDVQAALQSEGGKLFAEIEWKPPLVNAGEAGGYIVRRKSWRPGAPAATAVLNRRPVSDCAFRDDRVVKDCVNEYSVKAVHGKFKEAAGEWSFPAAVYGFAYMRYDEMVSEMEELSCRHPDVCRLEDAGPASVKPYRVWCAVLGTDVSDMPDRPGLLLAGNVHGSEIEGGDVCMGLIREIMRGWKKKDRSITKMLQSIQIRVIPVYNPCGRSSLEAGFPGGVRKNKPAKILKPPIDPLKLKQCWFADVDGGLDPNRTFDSGWEWEGRSEDPGSSNYPGRRPFAAPETRALARMARALRPQISVHYHGPCGYPLLTGDWPDGSKPVDRRLHYEIGREFARRSDTEFANDLPDISSHPTEKRGQVAQNWFYKEFYGAHFLAEGFYGQVPADGRLLPVAGSGSIGDLVQANMSALLWMAGRLCGAGIEVHVHDEGGRPFEAEVRVAGHMDPNCLRQVTSKKHGCYRRILPPGAYTVSCSRDGFKPQAFKGVNVPDGKPARLYVSLKRRTGGGNNAG